MKFRIKYLLLCIIFGLFGHYWPELMYVVIWDNFHEYWIRWILWELILNDWNYFVRGLLNLFNIWFDFVFNVIKFGLINFEFSYWLGGCDEFFGSYNMSWLCDFKKNDVPITLWIYYWRNNNDEEICIYKKMWKNN